MAAMSAPRVLFLKGTVAEDGGRGSDDDDDDGGLVAAGWASDILAPLMVTLVGHAELQVRRPRRQRVCSRASRPVTQGVPGRARRPLLRRGLYKPPCGCSRGRRCGA
jgi:hypothetical protein